MSTIAVVATVEASNVPPRVRLNVTDSGTPALTSTTITRLNPDGTTVPVRTLDGNPLVLTSGTGLLYDYEMPYGSPVSYSSLETPGTSSAQVTVPVASAWLVHPGVPALSVPIKIGNIGDRTTKLNRGVFYPMGRATPVVVTDGARKAAEYTLTVLTFTDNDRLDLFDILSDSSTLLLNVPADKGWGLGAEYVAIGDVQEGRVTRLAAEDIRTWTLPCTVVDRPAGGSQSQRTWVDVLATRATWADVMAAYPTWTALLAGP